MEPRGYKEDLKKVILDMAQKELENYVSQKGAKKYFEGNVDKVIDDNIKKINQGMGTNRTYSRIIKSGAYQTNMSSIARMLKREELFRSKNELLKFAKYLGVNVNMKTSYNQILRKVSNHIYLHKDEYSNKYMVYKRGKQEFILEPEKIKTDLIESYKSKTREDMRSIAKLLNLKVEEDDEAEDIRKKVINHIIKDKLGKKYSD
ncbi:MAG: hypothetical protein RRZ84_03190 [Romboutsia sp.]